MISPCPSCNDTSACSTPKVICLNCGDRGFSNAFVYCVVCLNVAVHRYCLDEIPATFDEYVRWVCDDCDTEVQNQPNAVCKQNDVQCKTRDHSTYNHDQDSPLHHNEHADDHLLPATSEPTCEATFPSPDDATGQS